MSTQDKSKFRQWHGLDYRAAAMQAELNRRHGRGLLPFSFAEWSTSRIERNVDRIRRALQSVKRPEWDD